MGAIAAPALLPLRQGSRQSLEELAGQHDPTRVLLLQGKTCHAGAKTASVIKDEEVYTLPWESTRGDRQLFDEDWDLSVYAANYDHVRPSRSQADMV